HVWEHPTKPKPGKPALPKTEFNQTALANEDLSGKFAAILARHSTLYTLDDGRNGAAIILKLLGAIMHFNLGSSADVLVISAFVCILKTSPTANVVYQNRIEIGVAALHVLNQLLQRITPIN